MRKVSAALLGIAVCVIATTAVAAPSTGAKAGTCVAENRNAVVEWKADRAIGAARVYFKSANAKTEHYVEMRREGGRFFAVLPQVAAGTAAVEYRVAAPDAKGTYTTRSNGVMTVSKSCGTNLSASEAKQATMIVVGAASQAVVVPVGFRCDGIIGTIDAKGKLRAQKPCADTAIAQVQVDTAVVQTSNNNGTAAAAGSAEQAKASAPAVVVEDGPGLTPYHHRRPRRAPQAPQAPRPRLEPPVSPARP